MPDQPPDHALPPVAPPEDLPPAPELVTVPVTPPEGHSQLVEQARIAPQTPATAPDFGTKMFVTFFFLIVPPLGVIVLAALCWFLFKKFMAASD